MALRLRYNVCVTVKKEKKLQKRNNYVDSVVIIVTITMEQISIT